MQLCGRKHPKSLFAGDTTQYERWSNLSDHDDVQNKQMFCQRVHRRYMPVYTVNLPPIFKFSIDYFHYFHRSKTSSAGTNRAGNDLSTDWRKRVVSYYIHSTLLVE